MTDDQITAALLASLKEAIEFQNEDTECFAGPITEDAEEYGGPEPECPEPLCRDHGCMVTLLISDP